MVGAVFKAWATDALDAERRRAWNDARALARSEPKWGRGRPGKNTAPRPGHERARKLKGARYALWNYAEQLIMPSRRRDALPDKGSRLGNSA
jgi:transposase